jgi:phosphohistidine phosphatase SixA
MPLERLIQSYQSLIDRGWVLDVVFESRPAGREHALPIIALRTPQAGEAVWILSGIHGEEPAGPNAIAASMDAIAELGARRPLVLLPLNNPHGYVHNWRYLNTATYSESVEGHSVGDSSHLLAEPDNPAIARAPVPSSPEAAAITGYILERAADYPPVISIDLHEDNLISEGYVYSQGELGAVDPLALAAVRVLVENNIKLKMSGETRFGETIEGGIIGPVVDSSVDELMSARSVLVAGQRQPGPAARTVLVFETPADGVGLQQRIDAHAALLRMLSRELVAADEVPQPALVFLVRHAEKQTDGEDPALTAAGRQRALELARLLGESGISEVYSTDFARTRDTAAPLARDLGVQTTLYHWDNMRALAELLSRPGARSLVIGHSDTTPDLVELLGGEPGPPIEEAGEYDRLYLVQVGTDGEVSTVLLRYGAPYRPAQSE